MGPTGDETPGCAPSARPRLLLVACLGLALAAAACSPAPTPSASIPPAGILFVQPGEKVQAAPQTEELQAVFGTMQALADNSVDLGYPWFDAATGQLVLSVVTPAGQKLILDAAIKVPYRTRPVRHGTAELQKILDEVAFLGTQGVPGAELIYMDAPDWRDNRVLIAMTARSQPLLDALIARFPADALAVKVDPTGAP